MAVFVVKGFTLFANQRPNVASQAAPDEEIASIDPGIPMGIGQWHECFNLMQMYL